MNIYKIATAIAAIVVTAIPTVASAETLKVSTFVPHKHAFNVMLTAWGEELSEKTGGELTYDLAATGAADIAVALTATTPGAFGAISGSSVARHATRNGAIPL